MKAEERKEIESNSLILTYQRLRQKMTGRTLYYVVGGLILAVAGILLYRYFSNESQKARDAGLQQLQEADTVDKLKRGMEDHRGTVLGSQFKLHLARRLLKEDGLPKLGTERTTDRNEAANNIQQARDYYIELTSELKEKENAAMLQEAWVSAAHAEEALVGLPATEGGTDYRGNIDKAIEYYEKAGAIFPDQEFSKKYKERAEQLKTNKEKVVSDYRALYKAREFPFPPGPELPPFGKKDVPPPPIPGLEPPKTNTTPQSEGPKIEVPPIPPSPGDGKKDPTPKVSDPKAELPPVPSVPADPKKSPEPKPGDPKAK